jgi:hypothetical protein
MLYVLSVCKLMSYIIVLSYIHNIRTPRLELWTPPHLNTISVLLHAIKSMHDSLNSLDHLINCSGWLGNLIIVLKIIYYSAEKHPCINLKNGPYG